MDFESLYSLVFAIIGESNLYINSNFEEHASHKYNIVRSIIDEFVQIKGTRQALAMKLELQDSLVRNHLHKTIHFKSQ